MSRNKAKKNEKPQPATKTPSPLERIATLESVVVGLQQVCTNLATGMDAVTALLGADKIQKVVDEAHIARQEAEIAESVKDGYLAAAPFIGSESIVVGLLTVDGVVQRPGRFFGEVAKMAEAFKNELVDKTPPVEVTVDKTVLKIERVYDRIEKAPEAA